MRKISAMYQWSGGTDYRHTCSECKNCIKAKTGKRSVFKCLAYGNTGNAETDWKASFIACKAFDQDPPAVPIIKSGGREGKADVETEGQISIFDFIEVQG